MMVPAREGQKSPVTPLPKRNQESVTKSVEEKLKSLDTMMKYQVSGPLPARLPEESRIQTMKKSEAWHVTVSTT